MSGRVRLAVAATAVLGSGVGHVIAGRDRAAITWIGLSTAALAGAALSPWLLAVGFALRAPCALELWWTSRRRSVDRARSPLKASVVAVGVKLALAMALNLAWIDTYRISSGSMSPTLQIGDRVVAFEAAYWFSEPQVGDVVVFDTPCQPGRTYIKRVVATAGDRVEIRCGALYLNDTELVSEPAGEVELENDGQVARYRRVRESARGAAWLVAHRLRASQRDRSMQGDARFDFPIREMFAPCDGVTPPGRFLSSRGGAPGCPRRSQFEVPPGHVFILGDNRENSQDSRIWGPIAVDRVRGRATGVWLPGATRGGRDWGRAGSIQ